jgi:autotransporter-associated beta strand protein
VANSSLLVFDRSDTLVFGGMIGGAGSVFQAGAGTTILTGTNSYSGGTTIGAGILQFGDGGTAGSIIGNVANDGALVFNRADAVAFAGTISGAGTVRQAGAGTLTLGGINSHTGGTLVSAGTLAVAADGNLGAAGATLTLDSGRLLTTAGIISGRFVALGVGGGTIDNGGFADLFSGSVHRPRRIDGDRRRIDDPDVDQQLHRRHQDRGGHAATRQWRNDRNHSRRRDRRWHPGVQSFERAGVRWRDRRHGRGGPARIRNDDADGRQHLFAGGTSVTNGRLLVDGAISGAVTVASGARLGGTGTIGGTVTIADGGHLAPGDSPGTLTVGALLLGPGSQLDYELGLPDIVGSGINDLTIVNGALTLDGMLNLTDAGGLGLGVYRLINYGGALTDNGLALGPLPTGFSSPDLVISTAMPGEVNLLVSAGGIGLQFWDGPNTAGNGIIDGGSGTWNDGDHQLDRSQRQPQCCLAERFRDLPGVAGTVTLGSPVAFEGMQFRSTGYVIEGGGFG